MLPKKQERLQQDIYLQDPHTYESLFEHPRLNEDDIDEHMQQETLFHKQESTYFVVKWHEQFQARPLF